MAQFMKGDIIVVPFPFSDLTQSKRRPALILAELAGDDRILCQITSQKVSDRYAIKLDDSDLESGGLKQKSNIRPNRIFTCLPCKMRSYFTGVIFSSYYTVSGT